MAIKQYKTCLDYVDVHAGQFGFIPVAKANWFWLTIMVQHYSYDYRNTSPNFICMFPRQLNWDVAINADEVCTNTVIPVSPLRTPLWPRIFSLPDSL